MIDVTKLLCSRATSADTLRYGGAAGDGATVQPAQPATAVQKNVPASGRQRRPVVVWNITRSCNLRCRHCYSSSDAGAAPDELTGDEGRRLLDDLAAFGSPAVLISGGEPLVRRDTLELAAYAASLGLRATLSTNGTLITPAMASRVKAAGFTYVGISLDGMGEVNDHFRGVAGAFDLAVAAIANLKAIGQRVGLRLTLTRHTAVDLERIFDFLESAGVDRACFYHLVYTGRGGSLQDNDLTWSGSRAAMETIFRRSADFHRRGVACDILTVDNHVDGVYLWRHLQQSDPARAAEVHRMLLWNGGARFSTGVGIGCVDFSGHVHPDQFWTSHTLGNVRRRPFSAIWQDESDPLLAGLRDRLPLLKGRCHYCQYQNICGGASRVRAEFVFGDPWAPEPACYLTDEEIGLTAPQRAELRARGEDYTMPAALAGG